MGTITFNFNKLDDRNLSVIVFSLFFGWLLSFPFEGQVFYSLCSKNNIDIRNLLFLGIAAHFVELFTCGFFIRDIKAAKRVLIISTVFCIIGSIMFFYEYSIIWYISIITISLLAGFAVASWGFYFKSLTPPNERIKTAANVLILSNVIMILINIVATNLSPHLGLAISILVLFGVLFLESKLSTDISPDYKQTISDPARERNLRLPLLFLCFFIVIITVNSGLMYQVFNPAFEHHQFLTSWYWAVPYIVALYIIRNLPAKANRAYILNIAIAMIGFSFISFMCLDRSAMSYIIVDTLMLGACGVFDLFWWSILGEMLDYTDRPAKILGIGLSANVFGVLIGGLVGNAIYTVNPNTYNPTVIALIVVFVILIVLPLLNGQLLKVLKSHAFLTKFSDMAASEQNKAVDDFIKSRKLTDREKEIMVLLLKGRTYRMIAEELYLSENTIKTHIKNIYSKFNIQSKSELIKIFNERQNIPFKSM